MSSDFDDNSGSVKKDVDKVGYKQPPRHTRFQKGRSGNPRGRPRGAQNCKSIAHRVAAEVHTMNGGGKTLEMPTVELILISIRNEMLKGKTRALKLYERLAQKYGSEQEEPRGGYLVVPGSMTEEEWRQMTEGPDVKLSDDEPQ